jgi:K+-transporting ATPase A subunit
VFYRALAMRVAPGRLLLALVASPLGRGVMMIMVMIIIIMAVCSVMVIVTRRRMTGVKIKSEKMKEPGLSVRMILLVIPTVQEREQQRDRQPKKEQGTPQRLKAA